MLPENNYPLVLHIEIVGAPPPVKEGPQPSLPPQIQDMADKVEKAVQPSRGEGTSEPQNGRVYPNLDPIRLAMHSKGDQKILERLLNLVPFKIAQLPHVLLVQMQPKKEAKETTEPPVPVSKTTTTAKGEIPTSDQKTVAEEIEGIARPQGEQVLDRKAKGEQPSKTPNEQDVELLPLLKETSQSKDRKEEIPLPNNTGNKERYPFQEKEKEGSKHPSPVIPEKTNPAAEKSSIPLSSRPQVINEIPVMVLPFPTLNVPKNEIHPPKGTHPVEKIGKVEPVQPPMREAPFRTDRTADQPPGTIPIHKDERDIVRIPMTPDMPLTRENLFKKKYRGSSGMQEDEGQALGDLIHMLLCAFICGAENLGEAWRYLEQRSSHYKKWLNLKRGIPSYRLIAMLMARLTPKAMDTLLQAVTGQGPTFHALQRIRIWETDRGLLAAQSNKEVKKCPHKDVLALFDIKGSIIQLDLPILDSSLTRVIRQRSGNYLYKIKPQHAPLYEQLLAGFKQDPDYRDIQEGARSSELREITVQPSVQIDNKMGWTDLNGAVRFNSEILVEAKHWLESRLYMTNLPLDPNLFAHTLRTVSLPNWIEWSMDCDFTDWSCNHTESHTARLKQLAWHLLELKGKPPLDLRKKAQSDLQLLAQIIRFA